MLPPDTIVNNRYRVVYPVDERPECQVYRARDDQTGRVVLLGVLPVVDAQQREGFARTARQITTVQHAFVLPLLDHFPEANTYMLVCEDAGGQDLERTLRSQGGALNEPDVLTQATHLLEAVEELHSQRPALYLGDPQLTDIWVVERGAWRLAPFPLLRPIGQAPSPYRALELAAEDCEPNAATDTYALCAMLYHVLSGWPPPAAEQRRSGTPLNSPRTLNPTLSALAEQALLRGLQDHAKNRYQHAREVRLALETVKMMAGRSLGLGPDALASAQAQPLPAPPVLPPVYPPIGEPTYAPPAPPPVQLPAQPTNVPAGAPVPIAGYSPAQAIPVQPYSAPTSGRSGLSTGCLIALAVTLTFLAVLIGLALLLLLPGSPLRAVLGFGGLPFATVQPATPAPTAVPQPTAPAANAAQPTAPAAGVAQPTLEPANLGPNPITLQNAGEITRTMEITTDLAGPVAFSPDGSQVAIGITDRISLRPADLSDSGTDLRGHIGLVGSLAWSPDGKLLASGAINDNVIRVWDAQTKQPVRQLTGHDGWIRSLAWSPDGKLLASGSIDRTVRLWDPATGNLLQTLNGHTGILSGVAFSPDNTLVASAARDGSVRLWDVTTGQEKAGFEFRMPSDPATNLRLWTTGVAFSGDGKQIAVGAVDGVVRLIDSTTGKEIRQLTGHTDWVVIRGVAYAPDGKMLLTAGFDGSIRVWNTDIGQEIGLFRGHQLRVAGFSLSPDGKRLLSTSSEDGVIYLWNVDDRSRLGVLRLGQGLVTSLTYAPDSSAIGLVGFNSTLQIYRLAQQRGQLIQGSTATAQPLAFLRSDQIVTVSDQGTLVVLTTGDTQGRALNGLDGTPLAVIASRDGSLVVAGSSTGEIGLWDPSQSQPKQTLKSQLSVIYALSLSSDGSLLAVAGPPDDPQIEVWDLTTSRQLQTLDGSVNGLTGIAFQPRGTLLAATDRGGSLRIWRAREGSLVRTIQAAPEEQRFTGLAFSPDGTMIAGGALNGDVIFWDAGTGNEVARVPMTQGIPVALAFSPDGQQLAVSLRTETNPVVLFSLPTR
jgi:WD40 repeat protein